MNDDTIIISRVALAIIGLVVLLAIVGWLISLLTNGNLVITSPANDITLSSLGQDAKPGKEIKQSSDKLTAKLHPGKYVATIQGKLFSTSKIVEVKARHTSRYNITAPKPMDFEPVYSVPAAGLIVHNSQLSFLDTSSGLINTIDGQNHLNTSVYAGAFASVKWGSDMGIGIDNTGSLFRLKNGNATKLNLPFKPNGSPVYTVASNNTVYVADGADVYKSQGSGFKKIYHASQSISYLAAGNGGVVAKIGGSEEGSTPVSGFILIKPSGKTVASHTDAYLFSWSEDGKYLAATGPNNGYVFDTSLKQIAAIPTSNPINLTWYGGDTLFYTVEGALWEYKVSDKTSSILANNPQDTVINELAVDSTNHYIYASISQADINYIGRVGLSGQKAPYYVYQFPFFLPDSSQACLLNYINYTRVTIIGSSDIDPQQTCSQALQTVFQPYGIDTSSFSTDFSQTVSHD